MVTKKLIGFIFKFFRAIGLYIFYIHVFIGIIFIIIFESLFSSIEFLLQKILRDGRHT
jgi:hypothetical protein